MRILLAIFWIALLTCPALKAAPSEGYRSDELYERLKAYAKPSNFFPDGNSGQLKLLIMCIDRDDAEMLEKLLNAVPKFVDVNEGGSRCSPIHWAAFKGSTNILEVLVKHGANVKKKGTNWDISPLHIAKDAKTANYLLDHGAELEADAIYDQTPLMWAAKRSDPKLIECLLQRGAKLNAKDQNGRTALVVAEESGQTNNVALLIRKGAIPLSAPEKQKLRWEAIAGIFSGAGEEHPFAEHTLIHGTPAKWEPMPLKREQIPEKGE